MKIRPPINAVRKIAFAMVTVREVDLLITRASYLVAMAVNTALNPTFSEDEFARLV